MEAVTLFAAGNEAALLRYAFLLTSSRSDAEDLVQTTFLRLLQQQGTTVLAPSAYARRMIYNEFCSAHRRKRPTSEAPATVPAFEHDVVQREWMWGELAALSDRHRAVLVLRYYEGLPDEQIADILGCRRTTVRSLAARALQVLRQRQEQSAPERTTLPDEKRT